MDQNKKWTKDEINAASKLLIGKKLSDFLILDNAKNKGNVGQAIETQYFGLKNNSSKEADFIDAGVELKVIPYKELKRGGISPKERMVLSLINYSKDYNIPFLESHLYKKIQKLQIIEYIHNKDNFADSVINKAFQYELSERDIKIMEHDYNVIMQKIKDGKAHEISESDTEYLGACTKGMGKNKDFVEQPFSETKAKRRAFSMKPCLIKAINDIAEDNTTIPLFRIEELNKSASFEELLRNRLKKYINIDMKKLIKDFNVNQVSKNALPTLISKMLQVDGKLQNADEFRKAGIAPKTARIINGKLAEQISFKTIDWDEVVASEWEDYWLKEKFETEKFAFFIFEGADNDNLTFKGVKIWSMPQADIDSYGQIYEDTREKCQKAGLVTIDNVIRNGENKKIYRNQFKKQSETKIGHVRPHGADNKDTVILPSGEELPKQSFWLNSEYVLNQIKNKK